MLTRTLIRNPKIAIVLMLLLLFVFLPLFAAWGSERIEEKAPPSPYLQLIEKIERRYDKSIRKAREKFPRIRAEKIKAMIVVESGGNPLAISGVGALGAMQIMPETALSIGCEKNLFDQDSNVLCGVAYLNHLLNQGFEEDYLIAAFGYGPGKIRSSLEKGRSVDHLSYVRKVKEVLSLLE